MTECRTTLLDCRDLAEQLKNELKKLEGHSNLWEMADVIYRELVSRARKEPEKPPEPPAEERPKEEVLDLMAALKASLKASQEPGR